MSPSALTVGPMTAEEFFAWVRQPANQGKRFELVRGKVVEMSRPGERRCLICGNVGWVLNNYVRARCRGYVLTNDPGVLLEKDPDTVRGPDVALFDAQRDYEDLNPKFTENLPSLAVEVFSPTDRIGKVTRRITQFLRAGVRMVWLIDPEARDVTVCHQGQEQQVFEVGETLTAEDVLPEFRRAVADFFFLPGGA